MLSEGCLREFIGAALIALQIYFKQGGPIPKTSRGQVIVDRKVSEFGSHQDLMKASGRYSQLFELQAAGYR